jgi:hypothetical protein
LGLALAAIGVCHVLGFWASGDSKGRVMVWGETINSTMAHFRVLFQAAPWFFGCLRMTLAIREIFGVGHQPMSAIQRNLT